MAELRGWRRPSVDDNLTREERAGYRQHQSAILDRLRETREEQEEALEEFADQQGYNTDDVGEWLDAKDKFSKRDAGSEFEANCESELEVLEEEYRSFIHQRFENPQEETKKDRIVATLRAFGVPANKPVFSKESRGHSHARCRKRIAPTYWSETGTNAYGVVRRLILRFITLFLFLRAVVMKQPIWRLSVPIATKMPVFLTRRGEGKSPRIRRENLKHGLTIS